MYDTARAEFYGDDLDGTYFAGLSVEDDFEAFADEAELAGFYDERFEAMGLDPFADARDAEHASYLAELAEDRLVNGLWQDHWGAVELHGIFFAPAERHRKRADRLEDDLLDVWTGKQRRAAGKARDAQRRAAEDEQARKARRAAGKAREAQRRAAETEEARKARLAKARAKMAERLASETPEEAEARKAADRARKAAKRARA